MTLHHPAATKFAPLPRVWLMTDARNDAKLKDAIARLPRQSGIIFRHYHLEDSVRRKRFREIQSQARRYGHVVILADSARKAHKWGADGFHGRGKNIRNRVKLLHTIPVHDIYELRIAEKSRADLIFVSPVYSTRSHPEARPISRTLLKYLIQQSPAPAVFLGGMSAKNFRRLKSFGAHGWAAIDGLTPR